MQCPQCSARTEVTEKRGPFRDRRCTNTACGIDFTTREHIMLQRERSQCARTRATKIGPPDPPLVVGVEGGSTSCPYSSISSEPVEGAGRIKEGVRYQQATAGS